MFKITIDRGSISLLILLVILFLFSIGFNFFYKATSQEKVVRYEAHKIKALFLADSGLEWAKASLTENPDWEGGTRFFTTGTVQVVIIRNPHGYKVISRSESQNAVQIRYGNFIVSEDNILLLVGYGELFQ